MITQETRKESFEDIKKKAPVRYELILNRLNTPKTAKEIAVELYELGFIPSTERNYTSPRITELEKMGIVKQCGKKKCKWTGKMVTMYERVR